MTDPWWRGLPPVQATVGCTGDVHRLRWDAGRLLAVDHPEVTAPGVPQGRCGHLVSAWERHAADPVVLVLASRGPADPLISGDVAVTPLRPGTQPMPARAGGGVPVPGPLRASTGSSSYTIPGREELAEAGAGPGERGAELAAPGAGPGRPRAWPAAPTDELAALFSLAPALQGRLTATVIAHWAHRLRAHGDSPGPELPALRAALYGRLTLVLQAWTGQPFLVPQLTMTGEEEPPALAGTGSEVSARLPFGWLADVWVRGLAVISGRFCIGAAPAGTGRWTVTTVDLNFGPPQQTTLELPPPGR